MSIKGRIEDLEKKYGREEGCILIQVTYDGLVKPPEGAFEQYIKENKLCDNCTQNRLCVLFWNGETFSHKRSFRGSKQQRKAARESSNAKLTPT